MTSSLFDDTPHFQAAAQVHRLHFRASQQATWVELRDSSNLNSLGIWIKPEMVERIGIRISLKKGSDHGSGKEIHPDNIFFKIHSDYLSWSFCSPSNLHFDLDKQIGYLWQQLIFEEILGNIIG